ncbi:hypothetical protein FGO68_gene12831 [Halteria grandinella]|uniref:Uncharacterized protein n=1 Tax=Halteria grandinella TaxID=5974 RepID=A0A8J8T9R5_HALGN|nr:hypothetical protein FGO68_gene12831 [Halteria grandinella]
MSKFDQILLVYQQLLTKSDKLYSYIAIQAYKYIFDRPSCPLIIKMSDFFNGPLKNNNNPASQKMYKNEN